ncbi:MAG TPA: hypothetical protein VMT72_02400 [Pseudolabrys sp.]|nr:hypothetical protein [Pseudolabrys sp.]
MEIADLLLSAGPAIVAIALQRFSIPSERRLNREASDAQQRMGVTRAPSLHYDFVGIAAVASLPIAFAAFAAGLLALAWAAKASVVLVAALGIPAAILAIWIFNLVSGKSFYEITHQRLLSPLQGSSRFLPFTTKHAIDYTVYSLNGLLALVAISLYIVGLFSASGAHKG